VTSGIRQGVLNLTPQPEAIQETSVQVNTFSSETAALLDFRPCSRRDLVQTSFTLSIRLFQLSEKCSRVNTSWAIHISPSIPTTWIRHRRSGDSAPQFLLLFLVEPLRSSSSAGDR